MALMDKGTTSTGLVVVHGPTPLGRTLLEEPMPRAVMEVTYCKIMLNMVSNKVLILFNIYIFCHLSYYLCFSCGKNCFLSGDYDKIVSNIKKLMQDPCSRSVFVFSLCVCCCFVFVF